MKKKMVLFFLFSLTFFACSNSSTNKVLSDFDKVVEQDIVAEQDFVQDVFAENEDSAKQDQFVEQDEFVENENNLNDNDFTELADENSMDEDVFDDNEPVDEDVVVKVGFLTVWKTSNQGDSKSNELTIPTTGKGYDYNVDCNNDGVFEATHVTGDYTCKYKKYGIYTVKIEGKFPRIYFNNQGDRKKILDIKQWGNIVWKSMSHAFEGCENLKISAKDSPNLSQVTDLSYMFAYATNFNSNISSWNVSNIKNMSHLFYKAHFNQYLNSWNVENVEDMSGMFELTIFNQSLNKWNVKNVKNMSTMFYFNAKFNRPLNSWNVSNVKDMKFMFYFAKSFNQPLDNWDVSNVQNMEAMFNNAQNFKQDLSSWDISNVKNMNTMFSNITISTENYDKILKSWSALIVQKNVVFEAGLSKYCSGEAGRDKLINDFNWTIIDAGKNCE